MRRSLLLLLLAFAIPVLLQSQITHNPQQQIHNENPEKDALIGLSTSELLDMGWGNADNAHSTPNTSTDNSRAEECFDAYIPIDQAVYTPVPRNDDGSLFIANLGFTFSFCGTTYTDVYVNTNGNLSFGQPVPTFSPNGFPFNIPMVAPFWSDVDTRNTACEQIWYQLFPNYLIVSWENVGWFNQQCSPLNTYQVIISDGTAPIIGIGNNVQFRYGDMEWTTGEASGGGPFGGFAATVGYNSGDNTNFEQIGRFNQDNANYDGPFGADDGVHYLDFRCYSFDASGGNSPLDLQCNDIARILDANCQASIVVDDVATATIDGCSTIDLSIDLSSFGCNNIGPNLVTVTATAGTQTETCTVNVDISQGACSAPSIAQVGPFCNEDFAIALSATPFGGTWSGAASPAGVFDPSAVGPGVYTVTYTSPNSCPTTTSINIVVNANPQVTINPDPAEFCENEGGTVLTANAFGGDGNFSYLWTTPVGNQSGQIIPATFAGVYTVSITDGNGCGALAFTNVTVNPAPQVFIFDPGPICNTEIAVQLTGSPTGGVWSGPFVTPDGFIFPQNMPPGITQVTYSFTNAFGCEANTTSDIQIVPSPDAIASNNGPYCQGQPIELFGNTNAPGIAIYNWTGPNGYSSNQQNPIDATEPGAYVLEVTVDGCPSDPIPTIVDVTAAPDAIAGNTGPYCPGQAISLVGGTTSNGNVVSYQWTGPNGYSSNQQSPNDATLDGIYELVVTVDGCPSTLSTTDVVFTQAPIALANNTGPYCIGDNIILSGSTTSSGTIINYTWDGPNGYSSNQQNPTDATEAGVYNLVIDVDGCISDQVSTTIILNQLPMPVVDGDALICEGENSILDGGSGYTNYSWSTGESTQIISVNGTNTIGLTVTDVNGCTGETSFDLTENPNPQPTINGDNAFCTGTSTMLDAGPGFDNYVWSNGETSQIVDVTTPGLITVVVTDANGCTGEASIDITENDIILPDISGDLSLCEGDASLLDAGGGYTDYIWSDGTTTQTLNVNTTGNYAVTVTDINGCTGIDAVDLVVNTPPQPTISGVEAFCQGESSSLDAGVYDSYIWSEGSTSQTISVDATGTYTVTVTDNNGCTGEGSINITVNQNPEPSIAGSTTFCSGFSTILDAGNGYTDYIWSDGSTSSTVEVSTGGLVSVTVTDGNGCTGEASIDITESTSLNPTISGDLEYCTGNTTVLDAGAGFETYTWSDGTNGQTISVDVPDDYSVTVTDVNGCSGETTVSIIENPNPPVNITGNDPICTGESITLDAGNGFDTYQWSDASLNQSIEVLTGGNYSVTVTDANGCTNETSVFVTENQNPEPTITGDAAFCNGESVILDGGAFDQYVWSEGSTSATIEITVGNTYSVTVTDVNGCTGEDQFLVTENQLPTPQIDGIFSFCDGASTILEAPAGFDYQWSNGETTQSVSIDLGGPIGLTVTDANGCTGETSEMLTVNPNPDPTIAGSTTFCIGNSTILDAGVYDQYIWSNGETTQTLEVNIEGTYEVTVTDGNGCTGTAQIDITESVSLEPVIAGNSVVCDGDASTLDAGSGFNTYLWSNGETTQTITVDIDGDYGVTVTDLQGCTGETSVAFIVNQNPLANIDGTDVFCEGESSILDAGAGFSYLWSNGEITQTIEVNTSDIYSVTIVDANGCEDEAQVQVTVNPLPVPTISGPSSFCSGNTATLDAGTGFDTYFWSNGETTQSITVDAGNIYSVTVTSSEGCSAETSLDVIENTSLSPVIVGDLEFCDGDNSILDAGSGFATYEWSTGETSQTITVSDNGNYGVIVTDADGCSGSTNVAVSTFQNPEPIIAGSTTFCTGSFTTLDVGNFESYLWSDGSTTQTIEVNTPGTYTVDVVDINGCLGFATIDVSESTSLNPVISGQPAFCTSESTTLDAGAGFASYIWSDGSTNQTLEVSVSSDYSVTVSDAQGCTGETTIFVIENTPPTATLAQGPELCNTEAGGSLANLYDLIIAGDNTGTWEDTDNSGALGLFDNLNFNGIPAGDYTFTYTTNSAVAPCQEVSYPVVVTIIDCACPAISFNAVDPLCNSNGTIDLNSIINTSESGSWSITSSPVGTDPATVNGSVFDATSGDAGTYDIEFSLLNMPPPGCPQVFSVSVDVENEVFAGLATAPVEFCADDSQFIDLSDLLEGEEAGGIWTEVSATPSQNGAFDAANGQFDMTGQINGTYNFAYTISPGGACPDDTEMVSVVVNELPTVVAGASIEIDCANPVLSLNAAGSSTGAQFDIQWMGGVVIDGNENSITPTVNQAGTYTLIITNTQTGCSASDVAIVTESNDIPTAFAGDDNTITCDDEEVPLQASGDIGQGFMIEWQGPAINAMNMNELNPVVDIAGTYILVITNTDNGCVSAPDTVIIFNDDDAPSFVIETPLSLDCNVTSTDLIGTTNGTDLSFEWFDDNNTSIGNTAVVSGITEPGEYILVVTNNLTGCSGTEVTEVFQDIIFPTALSGTPDILNCFEPETILDGSASQTGTDIVYTWSGPGVSGNPNEAISSANVAGTYILSVLDNSNGCESFDTILVDQDIMPPNAIINEPDMLDCSVSEVTLDGSTSSSGPNFIYSWLDQSGNEISNTTSVIVGQIGSYALAIQDTNNGCVDTTLIQVLQDEDVPSSALFLIENPDCFGDNDGNIALLEVDGGMAPYVFSLDGETFTNTAFYTGLTPGSYNIALQDANGCEWDTTINIVEPLEVDLNLGGDLELVIGDSAIVQAEINIPMENVDTIIWSSTASTIDCGNPDCLEIGFSSFDTETVSATLVDINGCVDEDEITVFVNRDKHVFIPNIFTPNGDGENDRFFIFADEEQVVRINKFIVFNRWGESVYEALNFLPNDPDNGWDGKFRDEMMNPAVFVYLAEIEFIDGEVILFKGDVTLVR